MQGSVQLYNVYIWHLYSAVDPQANVHIVQ